MPLTGKKLLKLAKKNGWKEVRQDGSHHIMYKEGFQPVSIPVHSNKDLRVGIEQALLKELGLK
ncbi:MAG: type II toxin-antitoxin system HicA family toxin [Lactobacillales bacterium]|jgi:predicted RNA binding protein YcfA (HicA-like mRNA interferase family)|nr:type II toxin-antitoxin system HicA family toxin [Lactobacillales bacterium]